MDLITEREAVPPFPNVAKRRWQARWENTEPGDTNDSERRKYMNYFYQIHQLPHRASYRYLPFEYAMKMGLSCEDYVNVYADDIEAKSEGTALERIFRIHNADDRPNGRGMNSLSMSDVVTLNGIPYYCDRYGWAKVPTDRWQ